ncbi:MAG: DUF962 family protein [Alteromonadaceae bacterium]|nr:MAG: DUF962 family protein [Alteromonadaceae bacterium]
MALFSEQSWDEWIAQYASVHQHPVNRFCHQLGIPLIVSSIPFALCAIFWFQLIWLALALFSFGWALQFLGHYYEGKPPEFLRDWRFLFVGLRWWLKETFGFFTH